jgi:tetratricopeptide (TPR) repeat protein
VLDGADPARSLGTAPAATPGGGDDMVSLPVRTPTGETIVVKVSRRDVLRGLGAMAAASVAPAATPRSTPPAGADLVPIEHFQRMRAVLIDSDNLFGAGRALPGAYEQLRLLGQLQRAANGADAWAVVDLRAQFAELCAWLNQDLGDNESAWYWTDRALEWSHLTGDQALTTLTLARKSQLAGDVGDATAAVAYAEAAIGLAPAASRLAAAAHAYAAHGHALAGDRDTTARAYDRSSGILASTDEDPRWAWWGGWLDASYIAVHRAGSLLALGDHEAADREYELALAGLPDAYPRDRGVYLARAARARAGIGDVEGSVSLGTQALATAARSGRRDRELRQLLDDLAPFDAAPVEELRQLAGLSSVGGGTGP